MTYFIKVKNRKSIRFTFFFFQPVTDKDLRDAQKRLKQVMEIVATKKKRVAYLEYEHSLKSTFTSSLSSINNKWNFLRRTLNSSFSSQSNNNISYNVSTIKQDISTYEEISSQLYSDLVDLQAIQQRIEYSKTLKGKYFHVLGHFFSLYCVWKILISFINIIFNRVGRGKDFVVGLSNEFTRRSSSRSGDERYSINSTLFQSSIRCTILVSISFIHIDWYYRRDKYSWIIDYIDKGK